VIVFLRMLAARQKHTADENLANAICDEEAGVMARKLEITVDYNKCVGNAMCEQYAPNVFGLNDERQSYVKDPEGDPEESVIEAAENCPVSAITVKDADTGEVLFEL
jgi:ferredoxin